MREVVNAIVYIAQTGCLWQMLPENFPPFTTVQRYSAEQIIMQSGMTGTTKNR